MQRWLSSALLVASLALPLSARAQVFENNTSDVPYSTLEKGVFFAGQGALTAIRYGSTGSININQIAVPLSVPAAGQIRFVAFVVDETNGTATRILLTDPQPLDADADGIFSLKTSSLLNLTLVNGLQYYIGYVADVATTPVADSAPDTQNGIASISALAGTSAFDIAFDFNDPQFAGAGDVDTDPQLVLYNTDFPLPVELSSFTAGRSGAGVDLSWRTASERDNAGFIVLRDGVAIAEYRGAAGLKGHGTTSQAQSYRFTDSRVRVGETYRYQLQSVDFGGTVHTYPSVQTVTVEAAATAAPVAFQLHEATPNPFNPTTRLSLDLSEPAVVTATLYNALGQPVRTLVAGSQPAGTSQLAVSADGLASGLYVVRVDAVGASGARFTATQRVTLMK